ncbi:MAG TPA: hypothetical protein VHG30_11795, partial [Microvirga sp.]|nr:hypothetical protein [Microvirga sp.]
DDLIIGGADADIIKGDANHDWIAGDSARFDFEPVTGTDGPTRITLIQTTISIGGGDTLSGDAGADVILGGAAGDTIYGDDATGSAGAADGDDIVIGDNGQLRFLNGALARFATTDDGEATGGVDTIHGNAGADFILGGAAGDTIYGDAAQAGLHDGADVVIGDNGEVSYVGGYGGADALQATIDLIRATDPVGFGGSDTIFGNDEDDILIGGAAGDNISGDADRDLILGDQGTVRLFNGVITDAALRDIPPDTAGDDFLTGGAHADLVLGGLGADKISGLGDADVLIGDEAEVLYDPDGVTLRSIKTLNRSNGDADVIFGGDQDDILIGGAKSDRLDGGSQHDLIFGDNVELTLKASSGDAIDPRFRALVGATIYGDDGLVRVAGEFEEAIQPVPGGRPTWADWRITLDPSLDAGQFGDDYIAGGAHDDEIFGQLGNDTIQGDGTIGPETGEIPANFVVPSMDFALAAGGTLTLAAPTNAGAKRGSDGSLTVTASFEGQSDGDDYIEGNAGDDVIFGNLGQDDIIGGSSNLFSLVVRELRQDGTDLLFGGAGTDISRNHLGDAAEPTGHSRDADMILGDNGDIFRLVGAGGANIGNYVTFTYDTYNGGTGSTNKIIPRAAELLDYTPGGPDFSTAASADAGAADEIHGESGDDFIYGMTGSDVLFGEGQDDDLIGGWGHDWISGGTGDDGVIGDDGRILTSRNGSTEPLAGVTAAAVQSTISTPGNVQVATINVAGQLVKAVDLTPFVKSATDPLFDPEFADDLVYGGWGNDFLHAGWGDDGVSGAEALAGFYDRPVNPGNVLGYDKATGEFIWYDEYNPMTRIAGFPLNFAADEGSIVENNIFSDGDDRIFGDHGNDWLVGGTGRDNMYGGWGDDLLNADDDQATGGGLNLSPDTHASYEDRAFGGAGRDVLIGNTGGDRLIDWVGEFNSYVVPFAPFGLGTVSRALQPQLPEFLYALSKSDGADQTLGSLGDPRNGEPWGELGLVRQQDFAWQDQTGAPADPQAGNVPGGKRDVLRSADFNNGQLQAFAPDSGTWQVSGGALQVASTSMTSDAVAVYQVGDALPSYYEVLATLKVIKPTAGWGANSYVVFDYQSKTDFKFAGIDVATNKLVIGHRTAAGWNVLAQAVFTGSLKSDAWYHAMLSVNGLTATLSVNNASAVSYVFQPTVVDGYKHGLNWGLVGFGSNQSRGAIDNIAVQTVPPTATVTYREDFTAGAGPMFDTQSTGRWSVSDGRLTAAPLASGDTALALIDLSNTTNLKTASLLELSSTFRTAGRAGFVFDFYSNTDFKFAAIDVLTKQVVIGHRTTAGWTVDAVASQSTLNATTDYTLGLTVRGSAVSVTLNGQAVTGFTYNAVSVDGRFGLLTGGTGASFDSVTAKTNDAAVPASQTSSSAATAAPLTGSVSQEQVQVLAAEAVQRWSSVEDTSHLTRLAQLEFVVADLPGDRLAEYADGRLTIDWDAAGQGWFVDPTPGDDAEFVGSGSTLVATPTGGAAGLIDLLSVIAHEMGHAIGLGHSDSGVMDETRAPGERALPDAWFTGVQVASGGLGVEEEHTGAGGAENPVHDVHGDLPGQPDEAGRLAGNAAIFAALAAGLPVSSVVAADVPLAEVTLRSSAPLRSLVAETQITVSAKRAAAESGAAASRAGSGAAPTDLGDTDVGDLPGQSLDETRKRPGGAPALDALAPGLAVASRVAADAPIHETVPGSGAPPQSAPPMSSTAGGSFVDLTAPASRAASQSAATAAIEATGHQHRSSRAPASKPSAPTINWGSSQTGALDHLDVGSPHGTSAWLDDFLNHLGTTQAQRNPNAGLRVRPGATKAMA